MLGDIVEEEAGASLPASASCDMFRMMLGMLDQLDLRIAELDKEIARRAREDAVVRRLMA